MKIIFLNIFFSFLIFLNTSNELFRNKTINLSKESIFQYSKKTPKSKFLDSDHSLFNKILNKYVSITGKVNYKGLKSDKKLLDQYLLELKKSPSAKASKSEKLAFWINAYNAYTLKMIVDHYPVKSITSLYKGKPWDHVWIVIDNKTYSLNDIEHKIIRPQFKEPRIHFAVNCASISCPALSNNAYTSENLESMLENAAKSFINSKANNISSSSIKLSPLFDWYKEDFGEVRSFISKYSKVKPGANVPITYMDYNWNLNE